MLPFLEKAKGSWKPGLELPPEGGERITIPV